MLLLVFKSERKVKANIFKVYHRSFIERKNFIVRS